MRSGNEDYAVRGVLGEAGPDVHQANIIAVRLVPGQGDIRVISAAGEVGELRWGDGEGAVMGPCGLGAGGVVTGWGGGDGDETSG